MLRSFYEPKFTSVVKVQCQMLEGFFGRLNFFPVQLVFWIESANFSEIVTFLQELNADARATIYYIYIYRV